MSVTGHLIVVSILVTSFAVLIERAQLVAPDRIEIVEIDLNNVRVSVDETKLYNTSTPDAPLPAPRADANPAPAVMPDVSQKPTDTASLVEDVTDKKTNTDSAPDKSQDSPAPRKKTIVKVNREVLSLDRTLTISVIDALRVAMTRCWVIDTNRPDIADIRAVAHLTMRPNGTVRDVWFESESRADTDAAFAYVLDTIRTAINVCQPLSMLPANEFSKWEKIQLTFYPSQGKVM